MIIVDFNMARFEQQLRDAAAGLADWDAVEIPPHSIPMRHASRADVRESQEWLIEWAQRSEDNERWIEWYCATMAAATSGGDRSL